MSQSVEQIPLVPGASGGGGVTGPVADPNAAFNLWELTANNYSQLILTTDAAAGVIARVENSEGTRWLPGSLGGTYFPSGFYVSDGAGGWDLDPTMEAIASELQNILSNKLESIQSGTANVTIDNTDPLNPSISVSGTGGNTSIVSQTVTVGNEVANHDDGTGNTVSINESITSLILSGNTLTYTREGGVQDTIDLSSYLDNTNDVDYVSDIQLVGSDLVVTSVGNGFNGSVDLSLFLDDTNDIDYVSNIQLVGTDLIVSSTGNGFSGTVDLSSLGVDTNDIDFVSNVQLVGTDLVFTGTGNAFSGSISLNSLLDDTNLSRVVSGSVDGAGILTMLRDDASSFTIDLSSLGGGTGGGGQVDSVVAGIGVLNVDNTDPINPIVNNELFLDVVNGELMPMYVDTQRGNRILSCAEVQCVFGEGAVSDNDWLIPASDASDADSCFVVARDCTIVGSFFNCVSDGGNLKGLELWINTSNISTIHTTNGTGLFQSETRRDLNIDLLAGDRIRVRANTDGGNIADTVVGIFYKYRKA